MVFLSSSSPLELLLSTLLVSILLSSSSYPPLILLLSSSSFSFSFSSHTSSHLERVGEHERLLGERDEAVLEQPLEQLEHLGRKI